MRRVVISGMGIVSCLGNSLEEVRSGLREGRSGIEFVPERKAMGFRSGLMGTLKDFQPPDLPRSALRRMGQGGCLAFLAAEQAVADAGLSGGDLSHERTGVVVGNSGNMREVFEQCTKFHEGKRIGGNALQRTMGSSVSANLAVLFKVKGHALTLSTACSSGAAAIGYGFQLIRFGLQDRVLCGGVQDSSWQYDCNFDALRVFSMREDEPAKASRPFDALRDGLVPSGGAGFVVLEDHDTALNRGARIRAELTAYSMTSDGHDMTVPTSEGSIRCMRLALQQAGLDPEDIEYINAHATSTVLGDVAEAIAIEEVFGDRPYVSSTKSMTGHEIGAAGSNELVYTLLMMEDGFIAPSINIEEIDEQCRGIRIAAEKAVRLAFQVALSNSFGFGGVNTCLIVKRV